MDDGVEGAAEDLAAQLTVLERHDWDTGSLEDAMAKARRIDAAARRLGRTDLQMRARLTQGYVLGCQGQIPASGRIFRTVNRWAAAHTDHFVLAMSHFHMTAFFGQLGDLPLSLEHAVRSMQAVDDLGEQAGDHLRFQCVMALANALGGSGDFVAARARFGEAAALAAAVGRPFSRVRVYNNLAYCEYQAGQNEAALDAVHTMLALAEQHGVRLDYCARDTVGRVWLQADRLTDAVAVLQPALDDAGADQYEEIDGRASCLLALAEAYRRQGDLDAAEATLVVCRQLCEQRGLASRLVQAQGEQAELLAARGRYAEAFACHKAFHSEAIALFSAERDARAQTMQAIYETTEARKAGQRARAQAVRDPLTGLLNRRFVDAELPALLRDTSGTLAAAMIDLDHFKRINDTCSHHAGDQVLQVLAQLLAAVVDQPLGDTAPRERRHQRGFAARLGGEEFLLVLPAATVETAVTRLEHLRTAIRDNDWTPLTGTLPVTASIGLTFSRPGDGQTELLRRADANLYAAKSAGRDRIVTDPPARDGSR
ncbi:diguanylate cyclase [Krasilnikovia sp. MM14-A1004]|uniref:tetratricopeptide repeat-containing diguanylate cyclase n=1 Tax=Krasilnikovia sp. MM14-A1004 TaxID=3373541 RepID=UPI00399D2D47